LNNIYQIQDERIVMDEVDDSMIWVVHHGFLN